MKEVLIDGLVDGEKLLRFNISKITILVALFIIISASFMRQVVEFFQKHVGVEWTAALMGLLMIIACLFFLILVTKKQIHAIRTPALTIVVIAGLILAWQAEYPAEKIHILEFGALGWLSARDLVGLNRKKRGIVLGCLFCIAVGILDELFQAVLPYRVFDVRDILFNGLGGVWGVILYLLT